MKKMIMIAAIGVLSSLSYANASGPEAAPVPTRTVTPGGIEYRCELEGRGNFGRGRHQDEDIRCWVQGTLCRGMPESNSSDGCRYGKDPIEIKCDQGFRLEARDAAVSFEDGTLWINADKHDKLATLRVRDLKGPGIDTVNERERFRADLLIGNSVAAHLEGKCKFERENGRVPLN